MQKELEFNKIGMIETSAVLAGFTFTVVSAHFAAGDDCDPRLSGQ